MPSPGLVIVPPAFLTLLPSAARTTTGNGAQLDLVALSQMSAGLGLAPYLVFESRITAVTGTSPTMTVTLQDSLDGGKNWNTVLSLTAQTAAGTQVGRLGLATANWPFNARCCRISYTIGGTTPSFTGAVTGVLM